MTRISIYIFAGIVLAAAAIIGASIFRTHFRDAGQPSATQAPAQAEASAQSNSTASDHMPSSSDRVDVTLSAARPSGANDDWTVTITLHVAKGWHVNANPPSLPFLIATSVNAEASGKAVPIVVRYPVGRDSKIQLGGTSILVYDDNTTLVGHFKGQRALSEIAILITVQACSDKGTCLPPATLKNQLHIKT